MQQTAKINILDAPVDNVTNAEALKKLLSFLKEDRNHLLITPNPIMIMTAQEDAELMEIMRSADLIVPDGIGVVLASRLLGQKIAERVPGCDLMLSLFDKIKDTGYTVYLLGAAPGVAHKAKEKMEAAYKNLSIIGCHDGYFDSDGERIILEEINQKKPDILIVGMGVPRQEKWIYKHRDELPVRISAGLGGSIDIMAGKVRRAPAVYRKLGLEWLYRIVSEPRRRAQAMQLPVFALRVAKQGLFRRKK